MPRPHTSPSAASSGLRCDLGYPRIHFPCLWCAQYVDSRFTSGLEEQLDQVSGACAGAARELLGVGRWCGVYGQLLEVSQGLAVGPCGVSQGAVPLEVTPMLREAHILQPAHHAYSSAPQAARWLGRRC